MISFFKKRDCNPVPIDVHSHLLPGIDDGVNDMDEALEVISSLVELGYKKLITTPHINQEFYPNTPEIILAKLKDVKQAVAEKNINVEIEAAAEYFLDDTLMESIQDDKQLLTFGDNHLLFECSFLNEPLYLKEFIFSAISKGYKPVFAHPERYAFILNDPSGLEDIRNRGAALQVNTMSFTGHYDKGPKKIAEKMLKNGMIDFIGTDCHHSAHISEIKKSINSRSYQKALDLPLQNYNL